MTGHVGATHATSKTMERWLTARGDHTNISGLVADKRPANPTTANTMEHDGDTYYDNPTY